MTLRLPRDTVLFLIDMQKAIDDPKWGRRNNPEAEAVAGRLLARWRELSLKIIHIRHDSTFPASPYRPGQPGNDFKPEVAPLPGERIVAKPANSAFVGTQMEADLESGGHTTLVLAGVLTQNSVETTVRHAGNLGFRVIVAEDACAATDVVDLKGRLWLAEDVHALSLANLSGEYAEISDARSILAAIDRWRRTDPDPPASTRPE
jgi:nicotinamidase-related amidase